MEISDISATKITNISGGECIEFPPVTVVSKYAVYDNVGGVLSDPSVVPGAAGRPVVDGRRRHFRELAHTRGRVDPAAQRTPGVSTQRNHEAVAHYAGEY